MCENGRSHLEKLLVVGSDDDAWDSLEQQMAAT
jgi:hypothetical protein